MEEAFFRQANARTIDINQCISKSFHPDVFAHTNVFLAHKPDNSKQVVMEQLSCSISSTVLGIHLPQCTNCKEDRFMQGIMHNSQLTIWCVACGQHAQCSLPHGLAHSKIRRTLCSTLPYPISTSISQRFKLEWPQVTTTKAQNWEKMVPKATRFLSHHISRKVSSVLSATVWSVLTQSSWEVLPFLWRHQCCNDWVLLA